VNNYPQTDKEYRDYLESLYHEFPDLITWRHSITGEELQAGFCVAHDWLPHIRRLLENIQTLGEINCIEVPVFRDFKEKRGSLSIDFDGGDDLVDKLVDIIEENLKR